MLFVYFSSFFSLSHLYFVWQISTLLSLSHGFVCPTFLPDPILECARHKITSSDISKLSFGLILVVWFWHTSTLFSYIVRLDVKWCNGYTPLTLNNMCSCATLPCNLNEIYLFYLLTLNDENAKHSHHSNHSTALSNMRSTLTIVLIVQLYQMVILSTLFSLTSLSAMNNVLISVIYFDFLAQHVCTFWPWSRAGSSWKQYSDIRS